MKKAFDVLVTIFFILAVLITIVFIAHNEQQDRKKCAEKGLIYVQPFHERAYCAAGSEINKEGNSNEH